MLCVIFCSPMTPKQIRLRFFALTTYAGKRILYEMNSKEKQAIVGKHRL